jgi:hypothetical protein
MYLSAELTVTNVTSRLPASYYWTTKHFEHSCVHILSLSVAVLTLAVAAVYVC